MECVEGFFAGTCAPKRAFPTQSRKGDRFFESVGRGPTYDKMEAIIVKTTLSSLRIGMPSHKRQLCSGLRIAAIALAGVLSAVQTCPADSSGSATYSFTGTCSDCATETASLTLQNYTLGQPITNSNFVSFSYTSNLTSNTITPANNPTFSIQGALPTTLPGPSLSTVVIGSQAQAGGFWGFIANTSGSWCAGPNCEYDSGTNGVWNGAAPAPAPTPVAGTLVLTSLGLILLTVMGWILLRRSNRAQPS